MKLINFWLIKAKEKILIKIVEWAQRNNKRIDELSNVQIKQILYEDKA
jgi:hypothetical protein